MALPCARVAGTNEPFPVIDDETTDELTSPEYFAERAWPLASLDASCVNGVIAGSCGSTLDRQRSNSIELARRQPATG